NSLMNQSFDFGSSFDLINEQTSDDNHNNNMNNNNNNNNNNTIFDSVWSNFSLLSLKTS
ncbi:unnamed protein product, partial [Rotaria magnacalcarata]